MSTTVGIAGLGTIKEVAKDCHLVRRIATAKASRRREGSEIMMFWKDSFAILKKVIAYSRVLKWIDILSLLFWIAESVVYELLPPDVADKYRIANLLHWSGRTWGIVALSLALFTVWEGIVRWYENEVLTIVGPAGSLQHDAAVTAARIGEFARKFIHTHGQHPIAPLAPTSEQQERDWQWQAQFSAAFRADMREHVETVVERLRAEQLHSSPADQLVSLATITPTIAFDAAGVIFEMSLWASLNRL